MAGKNWQQVKDTFHEALRRDSAERDVFLDEACKGDIAFRIEVESLLISLTEAKNFLEQPVIGEKPKSAWQLENGQTISHYRIVSPIASGGMGEVYLAEDEQLRRNVALKVLPEDLLENRERLRRFQREAHVVSALNHPNILTIFEFGTVDDIHFMASEFVKGETLRTRLNNGRLLLHDTLEIAIQIASALKAAHEAGVVHRDIKPENVMIRDDGYVKVLDFGLAKLAAQPTGNLETSTQKILSKPGVIMGTVTYMSPEQARARHIDARSDLFSFGVVLFEMLTGRVPFAGETMTDVIAEIIQGTPRRVSSFNSSVPEDMDRIIAKCLEKDRDERYQTAADLLADLKRLSRRSDTIDEVAATDRGDQATEILEPRPTERSIIATQTPKRPVLLVAATAAIIVAALALGYWYYNSQNTKQIESIAVMPFINESGNAEVEYLSDGMTESLINSLSRLQTLNVKSRSTVFRYKGREVEAGQIGSELNVQAVLKGRVVNRGDELTIDLELIEVRSGNQLWGEQYERKLTDLTAVRKEIVRDVLHKLRTRLSGVDENRVTKDYTEDSEAYQLYLKGRFHALRLIRSDTEKAISYFQQAIERDPNYALAYVGLTRNYIGLALASELPPDETFRKAKRAAYRALEIDPNLPEAVVSVGVTAFWFDWDWAEAEHRYKRALDLNQNNPETFWAYAHLLSNLGRHEEALPLARRCSELEPLDLRIRSLEAQFMIHAGKVDEALGRLQEVHDLDANFWMAYLFDSSAYIEKGMYTEAVAAADKAKQFSPLQTTSTSFRGYALAKAGRQKEAVATVEELVKLSEQRFVPPYHIAFIYNGLGETDKALAWLEKGYQSRDPKMTFLRVEPKWNNLRGDPRFQDIMQRMNFPQ